VIELERTRTELLALIDAPEAVDRITLDDATDARFVSRDRARLVVQGHSRDELFPVLNLMLSERLNQLSPGQRARDVLAPLKNALSNAYKRGHQRDRTKAIRVEAIVTTRGVFVAVADEGPGFDVAQTLRQLRSGGRQSLERGAGFRAFEHSGAIVSFENAGRTLLLCRPCGPGDRMRPDVDVPGPTLDEDLLAREFADALGDARGVVETCRAYTRRRDGPWCGRFAVRFSGSTSTFVYTARLFPGSSEAREEIQMTQAVRDALRPHKLRVAEPVAHLTHAPPRVVYDFDPWLNLTEYLDDRGHAATLRRATERIGLALNQLQSCSLKARTLHWNEHRDAIVSGASNWMDAIAGDPGHVARLRAVWEWCQRGLGAVGDTPTVPGHGTLRWAHVHYGADGRFYLSHWERCARRHPGIDVASFVADLLDHTCQRGSTDLFDPGLESFARAYFGSGSTSTWWKHLPALVAGEIVARRAAGELGDASALELMEHAFNMRLP